MISISWKALYPTGVLERTSDPTAKGLLSRHAYHLLTAMQFGLWIAALAVLALVEKLTTFGSWIARLAGSVLVATGTWMLFLAPQ